MSSPHPSLHLILFPSLHSSDTPSHQHIAPTFFLFSLSLKLSHPLIPLSTRPLLHLFSHSLLHSSLHHISLLLPSHPFIPLSTRLLLHLILSSLSPLFSHSIIPSSLSPLVPHAISSSHAISSFHSSLQSSLPTAHPPIPLSTHPSLHLLLSSEPKVSLTRVLTDS